VPARDGSARVVFARTSDPPWASVIDMPASSPVFAAGGVSPNAYVVDRRPGSYAWANPGSWRSAGTAAYVIEIGQQWPDSSCPMR
jgi:hypothetical protein